MHPSPRLIGRAEAAAADVRAGAVLGIPAGVLMENAGRGLSIVTSAETKRCNCTAVAVLAGPGNNGGDGLVAARHLVLAGLAVRVLLVREETRFESDAESSRNLRAARGCGVPVVEAPDGKALEAAVSDMGPRVLLVDAVLGTGLRGPVRPPLVEVLSWMGSCGRPVVAADIPSGLDADDGRAWGPVPRCVATATFLAWKRGLALGVGPAVAGRVTVCDLGVPPEALLPADEA